MPSGKQLHWFAYKDDDGYWIESSGIPCLCLWTPRESFWNHAWQRIESMKNARVIHLRELVIRDPIYEYIRVPPPIAYALTPSEDVEKEYGPLFLQRLRHVKQTGAAYWVFPSARSSRFEHSLGVMELAQRVADNVFRASPTTVVESFACKVLGDFEGACFDDGEARLVLFGEVVAQPSGSGANGNRRDRVLVGEFPELLEALADTAGESSLTVRHLRTGSEEEHGSHSVVSRLAALHMFKLTAAFAALLHDIGHLPFSHTLEEPLEDVLLRKGSLDPFPMMDFASKKLHERVSLDIIAHANGLFTGDAWRVAVLLTLLADNKTKWEGEVGRQLQDSVFGTLYRIVSAEIDVDRLDFVARDGYESGAPIGTFDLPRIIRSTELGKLGSNGRFEVVFRGHCQGDLEALLFERFRLYKTIAYHHKVTFFDTAIGTLFEELAWEIVRDAFSDRGVSRGAGKPLKLKDVCRNWSRLAFLVWRPDANDNRKSRRLDAQYIVRGEDGHTFFDDADLLRRIAAYRASSREQINSLREAVLYRVPCSLSLWKRPADFRPIRDRLLLTIAQGLSEDGSATAVVPEHVQKFLICLRSGGENRRVMRWLFKRFSKQWDDALTTLLEGKSKSANERASGREDREDQKESAEGASNLGLPQGATPKNLRGLRVLVGDTGENLFGEYRGLRIRGETGSYEILDISSALNQLEDVTNEISYYVFVIGDLIREHWEWNANRRGELRGWFIERLLYSALKATVVGFVQMPPDEWEALWAGEERPAATPERFFWKLALRGC